MGITISGYSFQGPFNYTTSLEDRSGVYAIICMRSGQYRVMDVGESATVQTRVQSHERRDCWVKKAVNDPIMYAVYYTPHLQSAGRVEIEQKIREGNNLPCGEK